MRDFGMNAILTLTIKDLRLLLRDRMGFFVTFVFPVVYAVFFGIIFGARGVGVQPVSVAVIDSAQNTSSVQYVNALRRSHRLKVQLVDELTGQSCFTNNACDVLVRIPEGFELSLVESSVDEDTGSDHADRTTVTAQFSLALSAELAADGLEALVHHSLGTKTALSAAALSRNPSSLGLKMRGSKKGAPQTHAYELSFPIGIAWGVLGCAASFGLSLVVERTRGTLFRLRTAPVGQMQIIAGKAGACFVCSLSLGVLLITIGRIAFGVRPSSYSLLLLGLMSVSFAFAGIMVLLSVVGKTERASSGISWTILLAMTMLGGGMVPHFFMPDWLQQLASISPVRWAILTLEGAIWRDYNLTQMITPCAVLFSIGVVGVVAGGVMFRWTQHD